MAITRRPSRATNSLPIAGLARIASSARFCLPASGWNSASCANSSPSSSTICGRSLPVPTPYWTSMRAPSDVEAEVDHIAVAHDIVLALEAQLARLLGALLAAVRDEVVVRRDLGADEAALEVGMDDARSLRRGRPGADGPGAHFLGPGGEVGVQTQQTIRRPDDA